MKELFLKTGLSFVKRIVGISKKHIFVSEK